MLKKFSIIALLAALTWVPFIAGCASTSSSSLTGSNPVYNDKGRIVSYQSGYQAR